MLVCIRISSIMSLCATPFVPVLTEYRYVPDSAHSSTRRRISWVPAAISEQYPSTKIEDVSLNILTIMLNKCLVVCTTHLCKIIVNILYIAAGNSMCECSLKTKTKKSINFTKYDDIIMKSVCHIYWRWDSETPRVDIRRPILQSSYLYTVVVVCF